MSSSRLNASSKIASVFCKSDFGRGLGVVSGDTTKVGKGVLNSGGEAIGLRRPPPLIEGGEDKSATDVEVL